MGWRRRPRRGLADEDEEEDEGEGRAMTQEDVKTEAALLLNAWKTHDEKYKEDSPLPASLLGRTYKLLESLLSLEIAEKTALKELRERLKASIPMYEAKANNPDREEWSKGYWAGRHQEAKKRLAEIDAQERAGVKAEICNAWHGNDFSQCQLPKGHEGNHLCIMTWEWPTASNAASEQEKSL